MHRKPPLTPYRSPLTSVGERVLRVAPTLRAEHRRGEDPRGERGGDEYRGEGGLDAGERLPIEERRDPPEPDAPRDQEEHPRHQGHRGGTVGDEGVQVAPQAHEE